MTWVNFLSKAKHGAKRFRPDWPLHPVLLLRHISPHASEVYSGHLGFCCPSRTKALLCCMISGISKVDSQAIQCGRWRPSIIGRHKYVQPLFRAVKRPSTWDRQLYITDLQANTQLSDCCPANILFSGILRIRKNSSLSPIWGFSYKKWILRSKWFVNAMEACPVSDSVSDEPSCDQKIIQAFDQNVASFPMFPRSTSPDASCGMYVPESTEFQPCVKIQLLREYLEAFTTIGRGDIDQPEATENHWHCSG